jgi:hypothetical protein
MISSVFGVAAGVALMTFNLNPALAAAFPWLAEVAKQYDSYHFNSLSFEYFTRTNTAATGVGIMAVDPNAAASTPTTEQIISSYEGSKSFAPWTNQVIKYLGKYLHGDDYWKYTREGPSGQPVQNTDVGTFTLLTEGQADSSEIGKLYVNYDVVLKTPHVDPETFSVPAHVSFLTGITQNIPVTGDVTAILDANWWNTEPNYANGLAIDTALYPYVLPPGVYRIDVNFNAYWTGATHCYMTLSGLQNDLGDWNVLRIASTLHPPHDFKNIYENVSAIGFLTTKLPTSDNISFDASFISTSTGIVTITNQKLVFTLLEGGGVGNQIYGPTLSGDCPIRTVQYFGDERNIDPKSTPMSDGKYQVFCENSGEVGEEQHHGSGTAEIEDSVEVEMPIPVARLRAENPLGAAEKDVEHPPIRPHRVKPITEPRKPFSR